MNDYSAVRMFVVGSPPSSFGLISTNSALQKGILKMAQLLICAFLAEQAIALLSYEIFSMNWLKCSSSPSSELTATSGACFRSRGMVPSVFS